jgi:hypothetical protein
MFKVQASADVNVIKLFSSSSILPFFIVSHLNTSHIFLSKAMSQPFEGTSQISSTWVVYTLPCKYEIWLA